MHYLKPVLFPILLFVTTFCVAAEEFENGVLRVLVEQFTNGQISSGLPSGFPQIDLPVELDVLGSLENDFSQVVVLSSSLDSEQAASAIVEALMQENWMELTPYEMEQPKNGFIYPNQLPSPLFSNMQYCHDRSGIISLLSPETGENSSLLKVTLMKQALIQPGFSCQQQNAQRQMQQERRGGPFGMLNSMYMPRLVMPEIENGPLIGRAPFAGGFSGSSNDLETRANYRGDMAIDDLHTHFSSQLEEQGWALDSEWIGEITAGGNWTSTQGADLNFLGILTINELSEDMFELKFRLITRGGNGSGAAMGSFNIIRDVVTP